MHQNAAAKLLRTALAFAAALSLVTFVLSPDFAQAIDVEKTTATSNESNGNNILGGMSTRVTWEATVGDDEEIASLTLEFPEGTAIESGATVKATVLDGLTRINTEQEVVAFTNEQVTIAFPNLVPSGLLLRVEIYKIALPAVTGDYALTGSYVDGRGAAVALKESPTIHVIAITANEALITWLGEQPWVEAWNSVKFLNIFFNPQRAVAAVPALFVGWLRSLGLVLVGFPLAIPIGLGVSFLRMARLGVVRFISGIYVNVIRGTPLFLQMYIVFFGLPLMGLKDLNPYLMGILVLAMNSSAYLAEIFRAGIQSIHKGQFEAASSLGMNGVQTMFSVIIPQTVRRVIPTATSEFILLYKDTSLLAAVGVMEQMMFAKNQVSLSGNMTPYIVAACYYLIVTLPLTQVIARFERKLAASEGQQGDPPNAGKKKRRRLFGTIAPLSAVEADPSRGITPEEHMSDGRGWKSP